MGTKVLQGQTPHSGGVSYRSILVGALSFIVGVAAVLLVMKALDDSQVTFSVTGVISFMFGIALSSASIILAITAISLGRASEQTMVERSDESIRLQNEVFVKTTEALGRIESSTGVTEKRIEDIIAGRAGAIAERLVEHGGSGAQSKEDLEREIKESVRAELHSSLILGTALEEDPKDAAKREEAWKSYIEFKDKVLFHASDLPSTKTRKIGRGKFSASGVELVDGVYEIPSGRLGICTFSVNPTIGGRFGATNGAFATFVDDLLAELASDVFHRAILVFDGQLEPDGGFQKQLDERFNVAKDELTTRVSVIAGDITEVTAALSKEIAAFTA